MRILLSLFVFALCTCKSTIVDECKNKSYSPKNNCRDTGPNEHTKPLDTTAPTVENVSASNRAAAYFQGSTLAIVVAFSEVVAVSGTPTLELETGTTDRSIVYASGSGSKELTFSYTMQAEDTSADLDYTSTDALALNNGSIKDGAGNDADLTLPSPGEEGSLSANSGLALSPIKIASGHSYHCRISAQGQLKCWGLNNEGELGLGHTNVIGDTGGEMGAGLVAVSLGTNRTALSVAGGQADACVILDNGSVKCWGGNFNGALGQGNTTTRGDGAGEMGDNLALSDLGSGRTAVQMSLGLSQTCALLDNANVKCWGVNGNGQLGQGNTTTLGDGAGEMGDNLSAIDLGTSTIIQISVANSFACALDTTGSVKCWGFCGFGSLGNACAANVGDGANQMGSHLVAADLGSGAVALQLSSLVGHTCALLEDGLVKCWGQNTYGELGQGHTTDLGDLANQMGENLPPIDLGSGVKAIQVAAGDGHSCALLDTGAVKCWGENNHGQLGLGHANNIGDQAGEMGDNLPSVDLGTGRTAKYLSLGTYSSCAILDNDSVKCWGRNDTGQLGQEHVNDIGDGAGEMGDSLPAIAF